MVLMILSTEKVLINSHTKGLVKSITIKSRLKLGFCFLLDIPTSRSFFRQSDKPNGSFFQKAKSVTELLIEGDLKTSNKKSQSILRVKSSYKSTKRFRIPKSKKRKVLIKSQSNTRQLEAYKVSICLYILT